MVFGRIAETRGRRYINVAAEFAAGEYGEWPKKLRGSEWITTS